MSGGAFDYNQYRIRDIANDIHKEIHNSGRKKTEKELDRERWRDKDWYEKYPEDLFHYEYPKEVIEEFKKGYEIMRLAEIYAQRIDWLLSGDDGDETFIKRLNADKELFNEELEKIKINKYYIEDYDEE